MNRRKKNIWNQMETVLKAVFNDSDTQQYINSAQVRHAQWLENFKDASPTQMKTIRNTILPRVALYAVLKEEGQDR